MTNQPINIAEWREEFERRFFEDFLGDRQNLSKESLKYFISSLALEVIELVKQNAIDYLNADDSYELSNDIDHIKSYFEKV